jgi:hypothetical protein
MHLEIPVIPDVMLPEPFLPDRRFVPPPNVPPDTPVDAL